MDRKYQISKWFSDKYCNVSLMKTKFKQWWSAMSTNNYLSFQIYFICLLVVFCFTVIISCFITWPTPQNWQWGSVKNETLRQKSLFHSYVGRFQQHLQMEYISLSWSDILELVVPIMMSLLEGSANKEATDLRVRLKSSLRKIYGHHYDLINRYEISVSQMITDIFRHLS